MKSTPRILVPSLLAAAVVAAVLFFMLPVRGNAAEEMSADAKALVKLDDDWSASAASRDSRRVASFYAPDANAYPPNDTTAVGSIAAEKVWAAYFADPTFTISWKTKYAEVVGILGYTSGTYHDSFKGKDGKVVSEKGKYLCVWKKQTDGSWRAIHDMWNTDSK
jgi:ketosteroid isomerase-like protein